MHECLPSSQWYIQALRRSYHHLQVLATDMLPLRHSIHANGCFLPLNDTQSTRSQYLVAFEDLDR
jgi:hypothetical protein